MTANFDYEFVAGDLPLIAKAWQDFGQKPDDNKPALDGPVHFVPAMGGCFVVVERRMTMGFGSSFTALALLPGLRHRTKKDDLQRFKARFESGAPVTTPIEAGPYYI